MKTKETLLKELDILSQEYIRLLNDKDVLLGWGKPQLEALYASKVGVYQVELLQLQLVIKSLKRQMELVRSAINQEELPNFMAIEEQVNQELILAQIDINFQIQTIEDARHMLANLDSPTRSAELRKLFKRMAKQLHPDVNPNQTLAQSELWHKVKSAYESGDLDRLKALEIVYEEEFNGFKAALEELSEDEIKTRTELLKEGIKVLSEEINLIRSKFPFDMENKIKDEDWVTTTVVEIKESIALHQALEKELKEEFQQLKAEYFGN